MALTLAFGKLLATELRAGLLLLPLPCDEDDELGGPEPEPPPAPPLPPPADTALLAGGGGGAPERGLPGCPLPPVAEGGNATEGVAVRGVPPEVPVGGWTRPPVLLFPAATVAMSLPGRGAAAADFEPGAFELEVLVVPLVPGAA